MQLDWKLIVDEKPPQDGTNFLVTCVLIADEFDENDMLTKKAVRERYVRVAQAAFGGTIIIPYSGGIVTNETITHWADMPDLPPE